MARHRRRAARSQGFGKPETSATGGDAASAIYGRCSRSGAGVDAAQTVARPPVAQFASFRPPRVLAGAKG
jgi:hypothetical protein